MAVLTFYPSGMTGSITSSHTREPGKKSNSVGWSPTATRNNVKFLRSIYPDSLKNENEIGIAFTFTIRDCPDTAKDWAKLRDTFFKRLRRMGLIRLHWVTEWQRRGVPHLHGMAFFDCPAGTYFNTSRFFNSWIESAFQYGASLHSQHMQELTDAVGWFQYLSKHSARASDHYQRSMDNIPDGWKGVSVGRVWGYIGDWDVSEPKKVSVSTAFFHRFRRDVRNWRISNSRERIKKYPDKKFGSSRSLISARTMLRCNDIKKSSVRGFSEWIDSDTALNLTEFTMKYYEIYFDDE